MTQEELKHYRELGNKFWDDCDRVVKTMGQYDINYRFVTHYDLNGDEVYATGCDFEVELYFPAELLTFTDEELEVYAFNLDMERHEKEEREAKKKAKLQKEKDLEEYKRLKEKLGL